MNDPQIFPRTAVKLSIRENRSVALYSDETYSFKLDLVESVLAQLKAFGLEGHTSENDGSEDCWGNLDGEAWWVRIIDGSSL